MKKGIITAAALLLITCLSTTVCYAGGDWDCQAHDCDYQKAVKPSNKDYETVDTLTLYSSDGNYVFSGQDADADGTVTMTAGNTYNFSLDQINMGYATYNDSGIVFRNEGGAVVLPLNEADKYVYAADYQFTSEHVDFIDITLNEAVASAGNEYYGRETSMPMFSFTGKVVITCTFEANTIVSSDQDLTQAPYCNDYYTMITESTKLDSPETVTYTLTIDGESSGVYLSDEVLTNDAGVNYYSTAVCYKPEADGKFPTSEYSLTIDDKDGSNTYDLLDAANSTRSTEVDIRFFISDQYTTKTVEAVRPTAKHSSSGEHQSAAAETEEKAEEEKTESTGSSFPVAAVAGAGVVVAGAAAVAAKVLTAAKK